MSVRTSGASVSKTASSDCKKGGVKGLILEFEQLRVNYKTESVGMLRMGADQSSITKQQGNTRPATISSTSLVKQRVSQFDYKLESENQIDKKKRHKSIGENSNLTKDFQRSKSYDYVRREKDRYSRARQVTPKIKEEVFKFDVPNEKPTSKGDSNNNSIRKRSSRRKPGQETPTENENKNDIKTSLKSQQPEIATQETNKEDCAETKVIRKDKSRNENKTRAVSRSTNRGTVKSVKNIKKIFEPNSSPKTIKEETLSISDTIITNDDKLGSNKHIAGDNGVLDENFSKNFEKYFQDEHCDKNKTTSNQANETFKHVENNHLNGSGEEFYKNNSVADCNYNYSEDEFNQIANKFQEVEQTIKEIEKNHSNNNLFAENEEGAQAESIENQRNADLEEPENIDVYVDKCTAGDELEDEFGKRSFSDFENINFTEAYNRDGDELIITSVATVEHRSLSENFTSSEFLVLDDVVEMVQVPMISSANEESGQRVEEATASYNELDNAVDNKLYYSIEELQDTESEIQSNRSTFYLSTTTNSTESMERYSKGESDEEYDKENEHIYEEIRLENNVEIRSNSGGGYDRTIKTETIYDSFQNPRIAKVSNVKSEECVNKAESPTMEEAESLETLKSPGSLKLKKDYLIEELIDTEKKYINHLEKVVSDYIPATRDDKISPSLIGKSHYLFGNIYKIHRTTQDFYRALKICGNDHEEIAKTFINFKHLFELYPIYSKNKPKADRYLLGDFKDVVSAREKELNDRLGLASHLLTPIQRLGKYILFLEQIQKELLKKGFASDNIYKAIQVVRKQMSRGNDYIAIDSIKDCPYSLLEQGSFVMREKFNVIKPRKYEAMVFMFEEMIVLTTVDPKNQELFIYRDSIKLNEMGIVTFDDQPLVFHLKRFPSYKKGPKEQNEFVIEAKKNKVKKTWTEQIEKRLWEQLVKCKEKQRELHSNQGKRTSVMELPDRIRRKKPGYSSLPSEMRKNSTQSIFYYKVDRDA